MDIPISKNKIKNPTPAKFVSSVYDDYMLLVRELHELNILFRSVNRIVAYEVKAKVEEFTNKMITSLQKRSKVDDAESIQISETIDNYVAQATCDIINNIELFSDDMGQNTTDYRCIVVTHREAIIERFSHCYFIMIDFFQSYLGQNKSIDINHTYSKKLLKEFAKSLNIKLEILKSISVVIDRFEEIESMYTPTGNQMICQEMIEYSHDLFNFLMDLDYEADFSEDVDCSSSNCCN